MHKDKFTEISLRLFALAVVGVVFLSAHALAQSRGPVSEHGANADQDITEIPSFIDKLLSFGEETPSDRHRSPPRPAHKPAHSAQAPTDSDRNALRAKPLSEEQTRTALSDRDARLYKSIFTLQDHGAWTEADRLIAQIRDERLAGYILAQRYLHPDYKPRYGELQAWMETCSDYPMAPRIYHLAMIRKTSANKAERSLPLHKPDVSRQLKITPVAAGEGPFDFSNIPDEIKESGLSGGRRTRPPGWSAALSAWRREEYGTAADLFEKAFRSKDSSDWGRAASAFWASRAHMRAGALTEVSRWLEKAAAYPRTFYGLIATRALGQDFNFDWSLDFSDDDSARLSASPKGVRAMALAKAGRPDWAEAELRMIEEPETDQATFRQSLLAFATTAKIPGLAMELVSALPPEKRAGYDAALYPLGDWMPQNGYKVDPALVHAIIRQESRFDPRARSEKGATGLMQLMPATARGVIRQTGLQTDDHKTLNDPIQNLEIGQLYIEDLLEQETVGQDLISLMVAYNAGPGNLARWKTRIQESDDPLFFIESLPVLQTRIYAEKVMANYWIYRLQMGENSPSLDALAAGGSTMTEDVALHLESHTSGNLFWD